jgi:hypothetical protein
MWASESADRLDQKRKLDTAEATPGPSPKKWRWEPTALRALYAFATTSPTSTLSMVTKSPGA